MKDAQGSAPQTLGPETPAAATQHLAKAVGWGVHTYAAKSRCGEAQATAGGAGARRQYYCLLNEALECLYGFYSRNSSIILGGVEASGEPQKAGMARKTLTAVLSLKFSGCRAKIHQSVLSRGSQRENSHTAFCSK